MRTALLAGLFVFLADIVSKAWVHAHIPIMTYATMHYPYGGIGIFQNFLGIEFSISHITNRGAAWGALGNYQDALIVLRIMLIAGMVIYLFLKKCQPSWQIPLCLIIAGAIGNVADYFIYGHVVDMLHFVLWGYDFPVFNVADSAVSIGIFWLILSTSFQETKRDVAA